jgi:cyclopropane fatty-acyl-phospholipid synthase-like methyltransferase
MKNATVAPDWYKDWFDSSYYHKLYFERNDTEAAGFIHRLLDLLSPSPDARMLDVACGRGRHARILAARGFDVTGFDLSENSIRYALQFQKENLHFYQHDMRELFYTNYFDYAFNFFTSFGYFRTQREHDSAIRTISTSLKKKGLFTLDYLNVRYAEDHLVRHSQKEIDGVIYHLTKWTDATHFYKHIRIEDRLLATPLEFTEKVAKFSLKDFSDMFARHGLKIQDIFGNYQLEAYDSRLSPRLLLLAEKA